MPRVNRFLGCSFLALSFLLPVAALGQSLPPLIPPPYVPEPLHCYAFAGVPPTVRAQGQAELVGDIVLDCEGGVPTRAGVAIPQVNFTIYLNTSITSRILNADNRLSEATLMVDEPTMSLPYVSDWIPAAFLACGQAAGCSITGTGVLHPGDTLIAGPSPYSGATGRPNLFHGVVNGNRVDFQGVPVDAPGTSGHRVFRFTNIRGDATTIAPGPSGTPGTIQALLSIQGSVVVAIDTPTHVVAFVQSGTDFTLRTATGAFTSMLGFSQAGGLNAALASSPAAAGGTLTYRLDFRENFWGALTKRNQGGSSANPTGLVDQSVPGTAYHNHTETGFYVSSLPSTNALNTAGLATQGTRLMAQFAGIPPGVSVYVTTRRIPNGSVGQAHLIATDAAGEGPYSEIVPTTTIDVGGTQVGIAPVSLVNGSGRAVWEMVETPGMAETNIQFGVVLAYSSPVSGSATVSGVLAPTSNAHSADTGSPLPRFVAPSQNSVPSSISLTSIVGSTSPVSAEVPVNSIVPTGFYATTIIGTSGPWWLSVTPTSGVLPSNLTILANPTGLAAGTYAGTVVIVFGPNVLSVPVVFTILDGVALTAAPTAVSFNYAEGSAPPSAVGIQVSASTPVAVSATASSTRNWLSVLPTTLTTPGTVTVSADPTGLSQGTYTGTITLVPTSGDMKIVPVTLTVARNAIANIAAGNNQRAIVGQQYALLQVRVADSLGNPIPGANVTFTAPSSGPGALFNGTALSAIATSDSAGIATAPALRANALAGSFPVSATCGSSTVTFTLTNAPVPAPPTVTASVEQVQFRFDAAAGATSPEIIYLESMGNRSTISVSTSASWLKFSLSRPIAPAELKVWPDVTGLAPGTHSAILSIAPSTTIFVVINVLPPPIVTSSRPLVAFSSDNPDALQQIVYVSAGPRELPFTMNVKTSPAGGNWLKVAVFNNSDRLAANLRVQADPSGLAPGNYQGTIEIIAPGSTNSPFSIPVTLVVPAQLAAR